MNRWTPSGQNTRYLRSACACPRGPNRKCNIVQQASWSTRDALVGAGKVPDLCLTQTQCMDHWDVVGCIRESLVRSEIDGRSHHSESFCILTEQNTFICSYTYALMWRFNEPASGRVSRVQSGSSKWQVLVTTHGQHRTSTLFRMQCMDGRINWSGTSQWFTLNTCRM